MKGHCGPFNQKDKSCVNLIKIESNDYKCVQDKYTNLNKKKCC